MNRSATAHERPVAIVGCGVLGQSWAVAFLRAGRDVALFDRVPAAVSRAQAVIGQRLEDIERDAGRPLDFGRVHAHLDLRTALTDASYVQESTREQLESKREVFADLERHAAPDCILSSSTSSLRATDFTGQLQGRGRCVVVHPLNPPHLLPAVEVIPSEWTSAPTLDATVSTMRDIGQAPLVVNVEGEFPLTRLQAAVLDESIRLVQEGVLSPDDVDTAIRDGLGIRWALLGPFETVDLNAAGGFAAFVHEYGSMFEQLLARRNVATSHWHERTVATIEGARRAETPLSELPDRARLRDASLLALRAHLGRFNASRTQNPTEEHS
jgi:L-gulonate 3-dehydrogenase